MRALNLLQQITAQEKTQVHLFYCLICNQEVSSKQCIDSQKMYPEKAFNNDQNNKNKQNNDESKQHYINIFCQDCEQKFNTQDNQLDIFGKLIDFFEGSRYQNSQNDNKNQKECRDQKKLKIKDLIRLLMHMFNEITGIAQLVYSSYRCQSIWKNSQSQENSFFCGSKLQKFIYEHQKSGQTKDQQMDCFEMKNGQQNEIQKQEEYLEIEKEGEDKKLVNNFYMDSPFIKAPKRKFKQQSLDILQAELDQFKVTTKSRNQYSHESDRLCQTSPSQDFLHYKDQQIVKVPAEQTGFNQKDQKPLQNGLKLNNSSQQNKRYLITNKSVGNKEQLQKIKAKNSNELNISIQSNMDFGNNSFAAQNSSILYMMGTQSSQNQNLYNSRNNKLLQDFHSTKSCAQQILFGDGPASKKLLDIKQNLQKQSNLHSDEYKLQKVQNHSLEQIKQSQKERGNVIKRQSLILDEQKLKERRDIELNNFQINLNNQTQTDQYSSENSNQILANCVPQSIRSKNDTKSINSQFHQSQNSSQNWVSSTNYVSNKSNKSCQGSALENIQLTDVASSMYVGAAQNDSQQNNQEISFTQEFINLQCSESPKTPTNESEIDMTAQSQSRDFNKKEEQALIKNNREQQHIPKTLKYRKPSNQNQVNNIFQKQGLEKQDCQTNILEDEYPLERKQKFNFSQSNDNSIMGGLKSLNNSVNMSYLNKTLVNDHNLSQSTIMNNSKHQATTTPTPMQEKIIVKSLMKSEYGTKYNNNGFHFENVGLINEAKYIINAKWWREWLEYVGFNENPQTFYESDMQIRKERPKKLKNKCLLKGEQLYNLRNTKNIELKENLLEHYDYEAIPKSIFCYLKMWYGIDYEIIRFLKYDASQPLDKSVYLDLYPEKILAFSLPIGIRKRQKNSTIGSSVTDKTSYPKDKQSASSQLNKTLPSGSSKNENFSFTDNNNNSSSNYLSRENRKNQSQQGNQKSLNHQSLDAEKINITLIDSNKKTAQNEQNEQNLKQNSQRSVAQDKSKACNIF